MGWNTLILRCFLWRHCFSNSEFGIIDVSCSDVSLLGIDIITRGFNQPSTLLKGSQHSFRTRLCWVRLDL